MPALALSTPLVPRDPAAYRRNHIGTMRTVMALFVVWSHCFALYLGTEAGEPISRLLNGHYNAGNVGVRVFFILSGFLVTQSYLSSPGVADYFRKRIRRIYPGFIAATAICAFVVVPLFASAGFAMITPRAVAMWLVRALTLQDVIPVGDAFGGKAVNGALWSIRYEFWCYVGVAALGVTHMLRRRGLVGAVFVLVVAIKFWLDATGRKPGAGSLELIIGWPYAWFSLLPYFLAGMLARLHVETIPRSGVLMIGSIAAILVSAHAFGASRVMFDAVMPLTATYVTLYLAFHPGRLPDATRYGDFSYGIYLYGFPIQQMVKAALPMSFTAYILTCLILSALAGIASWHLVEKWFVHPAKAKPRPPLAGTTLPQPV